MNRLIKKCRIWLFAVLLAAVWTISAAASEDDNSLSSLGIITEGVTVDPEFSGSTWRVTATVPAGTTQLELDPVPSAAGATVTDITGTTLNEDGTGTVYITVQSANGDQFTYTVNVVTADTGTAANQTAAQTVQTETQAQTETETETETQAQTEAQTEDSQYVRVDKNTIQEAEDTITSLKGEITTYRDTITLYTRIMYALIAVAVVLLFIVINLILRRRDLKAELNDYRSLGYGSGKPKGGKNQKRPEVRETPSRSTQTPAQGAAGYAPENQRRPYAQPQGAPGNVSGPRQQDYNGLDVQPQTSKRKGRNLPAYETPYESGQPRPAQGSAGQQGQTAPQGGQMTGKNAGEAQRRNAAHSRGRNGSANRQQPQAYQGQNPGSTGSAQNAPNRAARGTGSQPQGRAQSAPGSSRTGAQSQTPQGQQPQAPQGNKRQDAGKSSPSQTSEGGTNNNVEIDMIDL